MAYVASLAFFVTLGGISIGHYLNDMVPPSKVTDKNAGMHPGFFGGQLPLLNSVSLPLQLPLADYILFGSWSTAAAETQ